MTCSPASSRRPPSDELADVLTNHHEKTSTIVTSNKSLENWAVCSGMRWLSLRYSTASITMAIS